MSKIYRGPSFTATYDAQDRVITYNSNSYTYNINGQRQSKTNAGGTTNYTFDTLGNLTAVSTPSKTIQYIIDGYGRRVAKIENGFVTRYYLWQDQLKLAAELNGAGQLIKRYVYTNNEHSPDYMLYQGNYFVFIKDHRGSILNVLNARTGQVMQSLKYSDWGKVIQDSNPGYQPFGFAGGMYETDTGLVHFGAREYDPEVGKWISKDPILFEGGDTNLYGYVLNDPMNWVDPSGLSATASPWKDEGAGGGYGGGGGGGSAAVSSGAGSSIAIAIAIGNTCAQSQSKKDPNICGKAYRDALAGCYRIPSGPAQIQCAENALEDYKRCLKSN